MQPTQERAAIGNPRSSSAHLYTHPQITRHPRSQTTPTQTMGDSGKHAKRPYRPPTVLSVKCVAPSGSTDPTRWTRNRSAPRYCSPGGVMAKSFAAERRRPSRSASATIAGSAACSGPERVSNLDKRDRSNPVSRASCWRACFRREEWNRRGTGAEARDLEKAE